MHQNTRRNVIKRKKTRYKLHTTYKRADFTLAQMNLCLRLDSEKFATF